MPLNFRSLLSILLLTIANIPIIGQQITVLDADSQESLIGVEIYNSNLSLSGSTSPSGTFAFTRADLPTQVSISYLGYEATTLILDTYQNYTIQLKKSQNLLKTFTLIGRTAAREEDLPYEIKSLSAEKLRSTNPASSADALENTGEVFVQRSQHGGGSPIVRGFEANKVLLVVDGVRLNNAIFRSGHLQNIITVDPSSIDKVDLIFGPGSLIYGSDALGGVIHINTVDPKLLLSTTRKDTFFGQLYSKYASASTEYTAGFQLGYSTKKWASFTSMNYSIFGDLRSGNNRTEAYPNYGKRLWYVDTEGLSDRVVGNDDINLQRGTAYNQLNILQKWKYQLDQDRNLVLNLQFSTSSNIPRYDALTELNNLFPAFSEWDYGPQLRWMSSFVYNNQKSTIFSDKRILNLAYQKIGEDRITRTFQNPNRDYQEERLDIFSISYDLEKKLGSRLLQYGLETQYNGLASNAFSEDIFTEQRTENILTRYPDGDASTLNGGLYLLANQSLLSDKLLLNAGMRYSFYSYDLLYRDSSIIIWPDNFYTGISETNQAFTYSLGARYLQDQTQIRFLYATAFRSPNIDDIAKIRIKRDEINIPSIGLSPENSQSLELSIKQGLLDNKLSFSLTGYFTQIEDLIVAQPAALPDGSTTLISRQDTFTTVANVNAQQGNIKGLNLHAEVSMSKNWSMAGSLNFTKGSAMLETNDIPLAHIPPTYGNLVSNYKTAYGKFTAMLRFNGAKAAEDFDASVDNLDLATPEGSLAYQIWSVFYEDRIRDYNINIGLENLLDTHYRNFASGVSGAGRNFSIRLSRDF